MVDVLHNQRLKKKETYLMGEENEDGEEAEIWWIVQALCESDTPEI